jgi:cephalosporin-C deacetylase-like acetyl esterase
MEKIKIEKEFDAVKFMCDVRTAISIEIEGKNYEQLKEYFKKRRLKYSK